jgi:hypothetical protein
MKFRNFLVSAAIVVGGLTVATPAFASVTNVPPLPSGGQNWNGHYCPQQNQGNQWDNKSFWNDNDKGWKNCGFELPPFLPPVKTCHDVTSWTETWTTDRDHHKVPHWTQHKTQKCSNPGKGGKGKGPGGGNWPAPTPSPSVSWTPGGPPSGGPTCTPVTFDVSSTGTTLVTETGTPQTVLTDGEEVAYGSPATDYYVINFTPGTPDTFQLTTDYTGSTSVAHVEGGSSGHPLAWQLTTVCPQPGGNHNPDPDPSPSWTQTGQH